jgi:hypothetical protein
MMTLTDKEMESPKATRLPKRSGQWKETRRPRQTTRAKRERHRAVPIRPSSSPRMEKMVSVKGMGR